MQNISLALFFSPLPHRFGYTEFSRDEQGIDGGIGKGPSAGIFTLNIILLLMTSVYQC